MTDARVALVVDDDLGVRLLLAEALLAEGWRVEEAATGREAIEAVRSTPYDVVFLDLRMPPPDGWAVLEELAAVVAAGHTPFVACTGFTDDATAERLEAVGVRATVPKSCPLDELRRILADVTGA